MVSRPTTGTDLQNRSLDRAETRSTTVASVHKGRCSSPGFDGVPDRPWVRWLAVLPVQRARPRFVRANRGRAQSRFRIFRGCA